MWYGMPYMDPHAAERHMQDGVLLVARSET